MFHVKQGGPDVRSGRAGPAGPSPRSGRGGAGRGAMLHVKPVLEHFAISRK
jgi:hypothetical protein